MLSEYQQLQRRLDDSIRKDEAKQKILRAKREEKRAIKKAGGGKAIAERLYSKPQGEDTEFNHGFNDPEYNSVATAPEEIKEGCMGSVKCTKCGKFHGYCREVQEDKEKLKMLPSGDEQGTQKSGRKGGLNYVKIEDLSTSPTEAKVLMVKYSEEGQWGPQVLLKLAFKGEIKFLGVKPTKKDPRYKVMIDRFGPDENNWVNERIQLFVEKDEFTEKYRMVLSIPETPKSRR